MSIRLHGIFEVAGRKRAGAAPAPISALASAGRTLRLIYP
jgi:hypothetical protein